MSDTKAAPAEPAPEAEKVAPLSDLELTWVRTVLTKFYHNEQPPAPAQADPQKPAAQTAR